MSVSGASGDLFECVREVETELNVTQKKAVLNTAKTKKLGSKLIPSLAIIQSSQANTNIHLRNIQRGREEHKGNSAGRTERKSAGVINRKLKSRDKHCMLQEQLTALLRSPVVLPCQPMLVCSWSWLQTPFRMPWLTPPLGT